MVDDHRYALDPLEIQVGSHSWLNTWEDYWTTYVRIFEKVEYSDDKGKSKSGKIKDWLRKWVNVIRLVHLRGIIPSAGASR